MTAIASKRPPKRVPLLRKPGCRIAIARRRFRNPAVASSLSFAPKSRRGRRPRPRATSRASAFLEVSPRPFTLENRRLPPALPQSSGPARNSHVSLHTLSVRSFRAATQKKPGTVQKLWTPRLPCGCRRKSKTDLGISMTSPFSKSLTHPAPPSWSNFAVGAASSSPQNPFAPHARHLDVLLSCSVFPITNRVASAP